MKNYSRNELLLLVGSVLLTLVIAVGLLRWFAPSLLGIPLDLQAVRVAEKKPPFYDNVFNREDYRSQEFLLKDPHTRVRAKPLLAEASGLGPHDILGFRNRSIPNVVDVLILGDSQTYGNNVLLTNNWPSRLKARLDPRTKVYTMATGGWGAIQYLDMFGHGTAFRPRVIVVAFYTGNDPQESQSMAYSNDRWKGLRVYPDYDASDYPAAVPSPLPPERQYQWKVIFRDGVETVFTPAMRLYSNDRRYSTVRAGYSIMAETAKLMADFAQKVGIKMVFIIVPTKELVYTKKIEREGISAPRSYLTLIDNEKKNIVELADTLSRLPGSKYVDVVEALQSAALKSEPLYPANINGHPVGAGYDVIADRVSASVKNRIKLPKPGLALVEYGPGKYRLALIKREGFWTFFTPQWAIENGWKIDETSKKTKIQWLKLRDMASIGNMGVIKKIDRTRFGPHAVRR